MNPNAEPKLMLYTTVAIRFIGRMEMMPSQSAARRQVC